MSPSKSATGPPSTVYEPSRSWPCFSFIPKGSLPGGYLGVDLFFVLSGFLITTLLLEEHADRGFISVRDFYRRRALRLLPALVGCWLSFSRCR